MKLERYLTEEKIVVPDLSTQQHIAQILEAAYHARKQRKKADVLTEQFLQSTFLHLFGDPVKNEKGWEVITFGELIKSFKYGTKQKSTQYSSEGIPVLRIPNVIKGKIDFTDLKVCSFTRYRN